MRILLLANIGLAGCIGPEQGAAPVQGNSRIFSNAECSIAYISLSVP